MCARRLSNKEPSISIIPGSSPTGSSPAQSDLNRKPSAESALLPIEDENSEAYHEFATALKAELEPDGFFEHLFADRIVWTAWRLQRSVGTAGTDPTIEDPQLQRGEDRAERALMKVLGHFEKLRTRREKRTCEQAAANESKSASWPRLGSSKSGYAAPQLAGSFADSTSFRSAGEESQSAGAVMPAAWPKRLAIDTHVSPDSPVVKGTKLTVAHVVTLVVDGWTWTDIVRVHPQLTEEDIRACLWYAVEEENASLRLD